ncbi:MAG: hypothetical protein NTX64_18920 [Elusimicrobia bacterium]|nr:hypothetical protein [Elusimicrobiota bacterium]
MKVPILALLTCGLAVGLRAQDNTLQQDVKVKVCNNTPVQLTLAANPTVVDVGRSTTLSWTSDRPATLTLTDVGTVAGSNVTITPVGTGDKTYTLSAVDDCGNTGTASITLKIGVIKVFLSGSRYYTPPDVGDYMMQYTVDPNFGGAEGGSVHSFVDSHASAAQRAGFDEYANDMKSWPRSVEAFHTAHVPGNTYIVDEKGNVIGSLPTGSLFSNGLPGLSYLGNPWGNGDYNKVFVGDATLTYGGQTYDVVGFASVSPIILDLKGAGTPDVDRGQWLPHPARFNRSRALMFDITATGFPSFSEWVGSKDGFLVALKPGDTFKGGENLFGNPIGFMDGYQKLGMRFDKNHDGAISGSELQGLHVWQDLNSNGRVDPGELKSVQELGITQISTRQQNLKSTFVMNGKTRASWDWWPTCMTVYPKSQEP